MPTSAQAALVFLVLVVPGFLYLGGYRLGRAVPEHREGITGVAKVIAVSALIAIFAWKLGGRDLYEDVRDGTALTTHEGETWRFVIGMLFIPPVVGFGAGELVDAASRRIGHRRDQLRDRLAGDDESPSRWLRAKARLLEMVSSRLLNEGPLSPQPRDLYIEEVMRPAEDGNYYPTLHGLGAFVSGAEIETVEWVSPQGLLATAETNNG